MTTLITAAKETNGDLIFWFIKRVDKGQITREKELER